MNSAEKEAGTKKKEIPLVVHQVRKPKPVEGFIWTPIKENPLKPQQISGWRREAVVRNELTTETPTLQPKIPNAQVPTNPQKDVDYGEEGPYWNK